MSLDNLTNDVIRKAYPMLAFSIVNGLQEDIMRVFVYSRVGRHTEAH